MYCPPDLQICVHECRVTAEDELYVATLATTKNMRLLELSEVLYDDDVTEFESLDMAVHMLLLAGEHSYHITRAIALAVHEAGYDGLMYSSYCSLLRVGAIPFETIYGISYRKIHQRVGRERWKSIPNLAIFGRPIEEGQVVVKCINRLILNRVEYGVHFGPVGV